MSKKMEFFRQMKNYFVWFIVFGLWSQFSQTFKYNKLIKAYSVVLTLFLFTPHVLRFCMGPIFVKDDFKNTIISSLFMTILFAHFITATETLVKSSSQTKLIDKFEHVDELFCSKLLIRVPYHKQKHGLFIRILIVIFTINLFKGVLTALALSKLSFLNHIFAAVLSKWIMQLRTLQVVFFIYLIQERLKLINQELVDVRRILEEQPSQPGRKQDIIVPKLSNFSRILNSKEVYGELFDICGLMNDTFGWCLLAIATQAFIDFTGNSYWIFFTIEMETPNIEAVMFSVLLILPTAITLSVLAYYSSSLFKCVRIRESSFTWKSMHLLISTLFSLQSRLIEENLHRIPNDDENEAQNDLIREFSMQVHHQNFIISANGFCNINLDLLSSVIYQNYCSTASTFWNLFILFSIDVHGLRHVFNHFDSIWSLKQGNSVFFKWKPKLR